MRNAMSNENAVVVFQGYSNEIKKRLLQCSLMPTASADLLNKIVQFVGVTDANYTNGLFYKCVPDDETYKWEAISSEGDKIFVGTQQQWTDLTIAEKTEYDYAYITDDLGAEIEVVDAVTDGDMRPVSSNAVYDHVASKISGLYRPAGSKTCEELTSSLLIAANLGKVFNMSDTGTTTSDFVEGAGKPIRIGDNIGIVDIGTTEVPAYRFDHLLGIIDTSNFVEKEVGKGLSSNDYSNTDKSKVDALGTASSKNVPSSGDAGDTEVVLGNDTRLGKIIGNNTVVATDKTPFLSRQCLNPIGFKGYVREKLVGASYAWNQLIQNGNFEDTSNWAPYNSSYTSLSVANNAATLTFTNTSTSSYNYGIIQTLTTPSIAGHKYLVQFTAKLSYSGSFGYDNFGGSASKEFIAGKWDTLYTIWNANSEYASILLRARGDDLPAINDTAIIKNFQITDLTLAFGSEIADYLYNLSNNGGIQKLRDMGCPIDKYTPYGNYLVSSKTSGKKIVGFNVWDEEWELGNIDDYGNNQVNNTRIRSKGYIPVLPNTDYYMKFPGYGLIRYYDANKTFVGYTDKNGKATVTEGEIRTTSDNVFYIRIVSTDQTTYNHNICINISDPSKNGQYEPYSGYEISLGNDELHGLFKLVDGEIVAEGDIKESNGNIDRKYNIVDLGSLNWTYNNSRFECESSLSNIGGETYGEGYYYKNVICAKYVNESTSNNKTFFVYRSESSPYNKKILIYDASYTNAAAFKNAVAGVKLIYEKSSPTNEQSVSFADPMSLVGATTEEYIDDRTIPCPIGAIREYMGESDDRIVFPSSPMSDGKRVLTSYKSGDEEQLVWEDIDTKLNYHDYTVTGDGTTTWGDLLASLRPIYESLSEDEKTFSKLIFRSEHISGNECLSYCGAYWYSRMGIAFEGDLWIDHASLAHDSTYYYQKVGDTFTDRTSQTTSQSLSLRVFVEVGNNS